MTFDLFTARSNLHPHTFVWGNVEKSFTQNEFETTVRSLQYMIKVVKLFSYTRFHIGPSVLGILASCTNSFAPLCPSCGNTGRLLHGITDMQWLFYSGE